MGASHLRPRFLPIIRPHLYTAVQSRKAVSARLRSKRTSPFGFARQYNTVVVSTNTSSKSSKMSTLYNAPPNPLASHFLHFSGHGTSTGDICKAFRWRFVWILFDDVRLIVMLTCRYNFILVLGFHDMPSTKGSH